MSASDPPSSAPNPADASAEPWLTSARISQSERRLRRWFVEWRVRTALSGDETNEPQHVRVLQVPDLPPPMVRPFDTDPSGFVPGAVREAAGYATNDPTRGLRLLILADWGDGHSLVVPFSPFQEPASTGEFHTGRIDTPLAVLCPWNSRVVPIDLLRDSWWADTFDADEIEDARGAFRNCVMNEPLPPHLATRIGAPINDPSDPRVEYQTVEAQIMADFLRGFQCRTPSTMSPEGPASLEPDVTQTADSTGAKDDLPEAKEFVDIRSTQNQVPDSLEEKGVYAASTNEPPPPDTLSGDNLLPGFQDEAERDSDALTEASILRLAFYGPESPRPAEVPTGGVTAEWPGGQSGPHAFEYREGAWRAKIRLNLPWPRTVVIWQEKKIRIKPVP